MIFDQSGGVRNRNRIDTLHNRFDVRCILTHTNLMMRVDGRLD